MALFNSKLLAPLALVSAPANVAAAAAFLGIHEPMNVHHSLSKGHVITFKMKGELSLAHATLFD